MARGGSDDLVALARVGDQSAWRELYARNDRRLTIWLATLPSGDAASAPEDVAAEAWLTAAAKLAEFRGSDDDFAGWLFTIARNIASNHRRTAQRRRTDPHAVEAATERTWGTVEDDVRAVDEQESTRRLLAHLSPREAEVVACIDVVGLDVAATARALDMSPTAVRVARHRALGRLRKLVVHPQG